MSDKRSSVAIKVLFSVAVLSALVSLFLLFAFVSSADERVLKSLDSAKVLVAVQPLAKGTTLSSALEGSLIEERSYPVQSVPLNSLQEVTPANSALVALGDIAPGQILLRDAFGEQVAPQVELKPSDGKFAVTVELGYGARLGTFLRPGVNVSIFATYTDQNSGKKTTRLLFESIQILAIGGQATQEGSETQSDESNFVTFAVDVEKADELIEAAQSASLYLALPGSTTSGNN